MHYSHEWKLQLGCTDDEVGDSLDEWERRVHPDDLLRARATVMAYLAAPWPNFEQEFRMLHKDGTYRWILAQGSVYLDTQGRPLHMLGSHIDVTKKKQLVMNLAVNARDAMPQGGTLKLELAHVALDPPVSHPCPRWRRAGGYA